MRLDVLRCSSLGTTYGCTTCDRASDAAAAAPPTCQTSTWPKRGDEDGHGGEQRPTNNNIRQHVHTMSGVQRLPHRHALHATHWREQEVPNGRRGHAHGVAHAAPASRYHPTCHGARRPTVNHITRELSIIHVRRAQRHIHGDYFCTRPSGGAGANVVTRRATVATRLAFRGIPAPRRWGTRPECHSMAGASKERQQTLISTSQRAATQPPHRQPPPHHIRSHSQMPSTSRDFFPGIGPASVRPC